jgi:hypothetical protein
VSSDQSSLDRLYGIEGRVNTLARHWRDMGELFRESHPEITEWHIKFATELEATIRGS